jgi:hypothetical protein
MTRSLRGAALLAAAALLAGCFDTAAPSEAPASTRAPAPTATVSTYELGTPVWYAGLVVTFERAVAVLDPGGGSVTVDATLRNEASEDPISIEGPVRLVIDGDAFEPTRETNLPEVNFGTTVATTIEFDVIGHGSADAAAIVIGRDDEHQPRIPLGPDGGRLAAFEPVSFDVKGTATAGQLRVRLRGAELRWDLPDWALETPAANAILTLTYDAAYVGTFAGGFPFTGENVALRLPDGTWVRPRADGRSQPILLIGPGKNKRNLQTRFEIPDGIVDELSLIVIDGKARQLLTFSLPG